MKILNVNDTKVVYHYLPSKLTNIQILTNVGSSAEESDHYGMAHILEHTLFMGSKKYPDRLDILRTANDIGGKINAWTGIDTTCYHITVLNDFFKKGFDLLADMYQNPLFPEEEFLKELNPILSEMRRSEDNPEEYLGNRIMPLLIGERSGHPIIGTEETIRSATIDKMRAFRSRYYGGNNVMLSIVGGVSEEKVIKTVSALFTAPPASESPSMPMAEYNVDAELVLHKSGITEAVYLLYYPALIRFHPESYKQSLMTYVLGGNDSGLLFERLREQLGMSTYGIYSSVAHFDTYNLIEVSAGIAPEELDQCHEEVMSQIKFLTDTKIDQKRLDRAKASLRTNIAAAAESSAGYNGAIATYILKGMTENPLDKLLEEINAINVDDILDIAQRTFNTKPCKAILLPE